MGPLRIENRLFILDCQKYQLKKGAINSSREEFAAAETKTGPLISARYTYDRR